MDEECDVQHRKKMITVRKQFLFVLKKSITKKAQKIEISTINTVKF